MSGKLEMTLRISLDRLGLADRLDNLVEDDTAFFVLGLVHAQLTTLFGDETCVVEMLTASGINPALIAAMNSFASRHKKALERLNADGHVVVTDEDVMEVFQTLHDVTITPLEGRWLITREKRPDEILPLEADLLPH